MLDLYYNYTDTVGRRKVVISQGKLSNLHKIGKYGNEIGEKSGKIETFT